MIRKAEAEFNDAMRDLVTRLITALKEISPAAVKDDEGKVLGADEEAEPSELRRVFELLRKRCMENYKRARARSSTAASASTRTRSRSRRTRRTRS